jgi:nitrous oxidase accessory protein NosD
MLAYQPGWVALPLGLLELGLTMAAARALELGAPLWPAIGLFAGSWLVAQLLGHAGLPLLRLTWPEDGGELGRAGLALALAAPVAALAVSGTAWAVEPPTVHLAAGIHQGPILLDHAQTLIGTKGTIVRGGILITADDVTVRNLTVRGGEYGIEVEDAESVELENVTVEGAELDGINARRSQLEIRDCTIRSLPGAFTQAIDISFGFDLKPSLVERCTIVGGREGIVTHFAHAMVRDNKVSGTELRAITMTEMSMGMIEDNEVEGALGVGIFCGDFSMCAIEDNTVSNVTADHASGDSTRLGFAIQAHYGAEAHLAGNAISGSPGGVAAFVDATIEHR